jgi:hypothetical protein
MTNGIDRILATGCSLSAIAVIMACFFAYKCFTQAVLNGYEATMTKIIELLSYAHTVYIKTQTPPKEISSCTVNNALNNDRNTNNASPLMPIVDYWEQEMAYSLSKDSITILSSGADLKMGTKDDISGVLALSTNRDIVIKGRYKANIFYQSNYSSHEDQDSSGHKGNMP